MSDLDLDALESRVNQRNGMSGVIVAKPLLRELLQAAREARRLREGIRVFRERCNEGGPHRLNNFPRISCGTVVAVLDGILEPVVSTEEKPDA